MFIIEPLKLTTDFHKTKNLFIFYFVHCFDENTFCFIGLFVDRHNQRKHKIKIENKNDTNEERSRKEDELIEFLVAHKVYSKDTIIITHDKQKQKSLIKHVFKKFAWSGINLDKVIDVIDLRNNLKEYGMHFKSCSADLIDIHKAVTRRYSMKGKFNAIERILHVYLEFHKMTCDLLHKLWLQAQGKVSQNGIPDSILLEGGKIKTLEQLYNYLEREDWLVLTPTVFVDPKEHYRWALYTVNPVVLVNINIKA